MIKSFIPGRIRFRDASLKKPAEMAAFNQKLQDLPGLTERLTNAVTGSVTLYYDAQTVTPTAIKQWLQENLPQSLETVRQKGLHRRAISRTRPYYQIMSTAFVLCLFSPAAGMWQLHRYSAYLLTAMLAKHAYDYRSRII